MPMIDVYAAAGTFGDKHQLAVDLATTLMRIEEVPSIPMFRQNTAAFVHDLEAARLLPRSLLDEWAPSHDLKAVTLNA